MNWEVANETKTIGTAEKQVEMIEYIENKIGLKELTPALREVAELRLNHDEDTLSELASLIGLTKSGIRNRFRRLEQIYHELNETKGEEK